VKQRRAVMENYEDYRTRAPFFDATRKPLGVEIILGCLARGAVPIADQQVLDLGCGTGNYMVELLPHIATITGIDISHDMLDRARAKLSHEIDGGQVVLNNEDVRSLPYEDDSFDAVICIQLLHHLRDAASDGWAEHEAVLGEAARVLRPGGVLVLGTSSRVQLRDGYWYYALITRAADTLAAWYAPLDALETILDDLGIKTHDRFVPMKTPLQGGAYLEGRGPLDEAWRAGDSTWTLVTEEELDWTMTTIATLEEPGELDTFVRVKDEKRQEVGQITFLYGVLDG
jgi:SAM-dependent methyltransferase